MVVNQRYSMRVHSRRQLSQVATHLKQSINMLSEVGYRYSQAVPVVANASVRVIDLITMCENVVTEMRDNI